MEYKITRNENFNSFEIVFDGKPSEQVRELLKSNGYRWHGRRGIWYGYKDIAAALSSVLNSDGKQAPATGAGKPASANRTTASESRLTYTAHGIKGKGGEIISGNGDGGASYLAVWYDFDAVRLELRLTVKDYKSLRIIPRGCSWRDDSDSQTDYFCNEVLTIPATAGAEFLAAAQGWRKYVENRRKRGATSEYCRREAERAERDADALTLAEQIASGETPNGEQIIAERIRAAHEREERRKAEENKAFAAQLLNEGNREGRTVEQRGDVVIYREAHRVQTFDGTPGGWGRTETVETVIAINIKTGEREQVQYAKPDEAQAFYNKFAA